ncbi:MAG: MoxR family ATPase [Brevefilum sp.]|nr:MoxR family ATPase [Brevefilum sp.]MDT8381037.1 MoxR family ATPase [Brevefilum sp.]
MAVDISQVLKLGYKLKSNLNIVIIGKERTVALTVIAVLSQGHILIEDVPGVGKTMLARSLAKSLGCSFKRIQFTPDMLPSDVTGVSIYNQNTREFEYRPGPLMVQIVLADEINRATPKTQSALLEAMEERQITVDGTTYKLPAPFMVMATQNPIEYEGTFPLPEAQLDRFLMRIDLGYTSASNEIKILEKQRLVHPIVELQPVLEVEEILYAQEAIKQVHVSDPIKKYIVEIVRKTRTHPEVFLGASPRGSLGLFRAGQARAALDGRDYVLPDDIKYLAPYVLPHRVVVGPAARLTDISSEKIVREILESVPVPGGDLEDGGV